MVYYKFGGKLFFKFCIVFIFCVSLTTSEVKLSKHPVLIIVSYDGFRYDYLEKTETPNLDKVKKNGVSVPYMKNQFATFTFPNHHSIATGLYAESHGIIANVMYDPLYGKVLNGFKDDPGFWNYSSSIKPLWVVNELAGDGRVSGVMMWPGCNFPFGENNTMSTYVKKYERDYSFENRIDDAITWITNEDKPANLVFLYFHEPDSTGHKFGPEGPEIINQIQRMDNVTGYFWHKLESLNISNKVNIIFLSDHGMHEVKSDHIIHYENIVANENNTKYIQYGSSPVLQILPVKEEETMQIYTAFKEASKSMNFSTFLKDELPTLKPQWHYTHSRRILPILLVADPGYIFSDKSPLNSSIGVHGYDNDVSTMHPYFMAIGPLFKTNTVEQPFNNTDIYPLVCSIMGMDPPGNNGSLKSILPLVKKATARNFVVGDDQILNGNQNAESNSWITGIGGLILGVIAGVILIVAIIGAFLYLRRRSRYKMNSMEMNLNS